MAGSLEQIAQRTEVALSTVSRALAGKPGVSDRKRAEIVALAAELGLMPDPAASSLRTGERSGLVVVTVARPTRILSLRNYALFARGRKAFGNVRVLVVGDEVSVDAAVGQALSLKAAAVVLAGAGGTLSDTTCERLRSSRVPLVSVDCESNAGDTLAIDRAAGTRQCARLLLLNGCERVVVFSVTPLDRPDPRLQGVAEGFASLGRDLAPEHVVVMDGSGFEAGYHTLEQVLRERSFDGAFCYSDDTALGALRSLAEHHMRVPEDAQIVGFDNVEYAEYGSKPLTTVAQPVDEIAEAAIARCVARLRAGDEERVRTSFPTHLVVRASAPIARADIRAQVFDRSQGS
jgi:LacI family repressor for deo operon, udp, cdd, tsx, nupC, and nupG